MVAGGIDGEDLVAIVVRIAFAGVGRADELAMLGVAVERNDATVTLSRHNGEQPFHFVRQHPCPHPEGPEQKILTKPRMTRD